MTNSCQPAGSPDTLEDPVPDVPPPDGICRQPHGLRKVESWLVHGTQPQATDAHLIDYSGNRINWLAVTFRDPPWQP